MLEHAHDHAGGTQAVTSSGSAEQIAVSSLITYDLYGTYINPRASAKQLIAVSRSVVVLYGLVMGMSPLPSNGVFFILYAESSCKQADCHNGGLADVDVIAGVNHRGPVLHLQRGWH